MKQLYTLTLLILLSVPNRIQAQQITGTWEGELDDEWLQINIRQEGNKACGYTYDYIVGRKEHYCRAYFEGYYDSRMEYWVLNGTGFYDNKGNHVLMVMKLWLDKSKRPYTLRGSVGIKSALNSFFGMSSAVPVRLNKISSTPNRLPGSESPCFEPPLSRKDPLPKPKPPVPPITVKPKKPVAPVTNPPVSEENDSLVVQKPEPLPKAVEIPVKAEPKEDRLLSRKNKELSRLTVHVKDIKLKVYDNGVVDQDTVSIYYNGRLLVNKQKLSESPILLDISLDENAKEHRITMIAENLGTIPPNTALIVVTAGKKRYELFSSASLEENAVLVFDYLPD